MKDLIGLVDSSGQDLSVPAGGELAWISLTALHEYGRTENQDNLVVVDAAGQGTVLRDQQPVSLHHPDWPSGRLRLAVLDGMGGHAAGREVAEQAAAAIAALPAFGTSAELYQALDELHHRLREFHAQNTRALRPPGTTLTLLEIPEFAATGCEAWLYHVGDSRLYEIPPEGLPRCLTIDHVPATEFAMQGRLSEADWRRQVHAEPHTTISQAFAMGGSLGTSDRTRQGGRDESLIVLTDADVPDWLHGLGDRRTIHLRSERLYMLASDGLWAGPDPQNTIKRWTRSSVASEDSMAGLCSMLGTLSITIARFPRFSDNVTLVGLRIDDTAISPKMS